MRELLRVEIVFSQQQVTLWICSNAKQPLLPTIFLETTIPIAAKLKTVFETPRANKLTRMVKVCNCYQLFKESRLSWRHICNKMSPRKWWTNCAHLGGREWGGRGAILCLGWVRVFDCLHLLTQVQCSVLEESPNNPLSIRSVWNIVGWWIDNQPTIRQ